ncbi:ATP-binding protein [Candidatus Pseudothioglobus singularis]|jgi:hypothetical protein|nr:ATP-binding protein [Candidatus Pseudothioglobus singularis]
MISEKQIPSPSRLVESLRDTGYSHQAAFADIVDNCIAANASNVVIDITQDFMGNDLSVAFYDNGEGMSVDELKNAMRYGSDKRPSPKSLGKFGMGLKTASTAFCRRLSVISIKDNVPSIRVWDIDEIIDQDEWVLLEPNLEDYSNYLEKLKTLTDGSGTVVIWTRVDRLITNNGTDYIQKAMDTIIAEISQHLSATFGKFLIGVDNFNNTKADEFTQPEVTITVNDLVIEGWNPNGLYLNENAIDDRVISTIKTREVPLVSDDEVTTSKYTINGLVLPRKQDLSGEEEDQLRYTNYNQGFYIYRENRLIYGGGWPHKLFAEDPHLTLLRVVLDFDHELDEYFEIDIRKSKVNFNPKMREELKKILGPWKNEASKRYRGERADEPVSDPNHSNSSKVIQRTVIDYNQNKIKRISDDGNSVILENQFGEIEVKLNKSQEGSKMYVLNAATLDGNILWSSESDELGNTIVILNQEHEFYRRFYCGKSNNIMVQAMDSVFWSLANAELKSNDDKTRKNFEEMRFLVSQNLSFLAKELPAIECLN